jgi:hypothetical protein
MTLFEVFLVENYLPYLGGKAYKYGTYDAKMTPNKAEVPNTTKT